jgi:adenosylhomocysteinase
MSELKRSARAAAEVSRINAFFPIMPLLGNRLASVRPFEGLTIGVSAHLTTLTAALVRELALGGGTWVLCAASDATTDYAVVDYLRDNGFDVYTSGSRDDYHSALLSHEPDLIAGVGGTLLDTLVRRFPEQAERVRGAVEVSKTGVVKVDDLDVPFPVVNINDGRLKPAVENRHGVGEGLWHAVQSLTGMHLSGRRVGVVGYGPVGRGVAAYARAAGAAVEVVESDPVRRLVAHYDGFPIPTLSDCITRAGIVVTCTGGRSVLSLADLAGAPDGMVLINAGHGGDEIDIPAIKRAAIAVDHVADHVVSYKLQSGRTLLVLTDGHPLNIVMNAGSPEPVLLHFALLGLTLEWLTRATDLPPGLITVPPDLENVAAELALTALRAAHG